MVVVCSCLRNNTTNSSCSDSNSSSASSSDSFNHMQLPQSLISAFVSTCHGVFNLQSVWSNRHAEVGLWAGTVTTRSQYWITTTATANTDLSLPHIEEPATSSAWPCHPLSDLGRAADFYYVEWPWLFTTIPAEWKKKTKRRSIRDPFS